MIEILRSSTFIFWAAITLIVVVPTIAHYWWKIRRAEMEAALKQEMIQKGMSAAEIRQVLEASGKKKDEE